MTGYHTIAVIISILVLALLSSKQYLTDFRERFSRTEL